LEFFHVLEDIITGVLCMRLELLVDLVEKFRTAYELKPQK